MENGLTGKSMLDLKYRTVFGIPETIVIYDNTEFTEYVADNYTNLLNYCKTQNIDKSKAEDLLNDVWQAYRVKEMNGKGFDMSKGHGAIIGIEEAVKANIKKTALNKMYHRNTCGSDEVLAHFTEDTEEDSVQTAYTNMASVEDVNAALIECEMDLAENITYFISVTQNCRICGLSVLEKLENLTNYVESGMFNSDFISDLWTAGEGVSDCFISIVEAFSRNKEKYFSTLSLVKEELRQCRSVTA